MPDERSGARGTRENPGTPWHMMTRPLKVEAAGGRGWRRRRARRVRRSIEGDFDSGLPHSAGAREWTRAAFHSEARNAALQLAGQLLRESVLGLMDLNQGRNEFRNRFRMPAPPPNEGPESPLESLEGRR